PQKKGLHPNPPPDKSKEEILLFFKLYDPEKEQLRLAAPFKIKSFSIIFSRRILFFLFFFKVLIYFVFFLVIFT
ncbi:hypothetical protein, partial [Escherichia coli]|uniref:hypothetical protein n=1 Tax=Escherichia coli TaxID=562 RepID=UPI0032D9BC1A